MRDHQVKTTKDCVHVDHTCRVHPSPTVAHPVDLSCTAIGLRLAVSVGASFLAVHAQIAADETKTKSPCSSGVAMKRPEIMSLGVEVVCS